jgi:predicted metal-dependent hydrolase
VEQQRESPAFEVDVRRSRRRTRTVSAYREGNTIVVLIPERLSRAEERRWVDRMIARVTRAELRRRPDDHALQARAERLSARYLDGTASPASVRWVTNQQARWGSCTPLDRTIRLSARLQGMPSYVVDYVLLHELTHLLVPGHGKDFWEWVNRFDAVERARGFLEGFAAASRSTEAAGLADGDPLRDADATPDDGACTGEPNHAVG